MLSTDIPPPDPQSSSSGKSSDERASDNKVDLFKSVLDDNNPHPKFSIRDYVFGTRGKDIKTHWPFSPKNLQLCLKHGVKDVLPPFQTLESVRNNPSRGKCAAEYVSNSSVELSGLSHDQIKTLAPLDIDNAKSSDSKEDEEYPSTTSSVSCSDVNIVNPLSKSRHLEPEAEILPASSKVERNTQKKCRLIVKLSNVSEPKANEESMASKVCPVCKTFSSSSNTTLNAHIDQCLSGESTVKWTSNSKALKHRIKPRKTKMMVDIYETAQCCTLEDLDRRNGTNWTSNLGFQAQDLEVLCEEEKSKTLSVYSEEKKVDEEEEESAVYVDSNGTKLRILSKSADLGNPNVAQDDCGPSKVVKRDKGSKITSSKKKYLVQGQKLGKYLSGLRNCSPIPDRCPEVNYSVHEREFPPDEDEREDSAHPLRPSHQMKSNGFGMIKPWVGSRRTGFMKKINFKTGSQRPDKTIRNMRVESKQLSLGDKFIRRSRSFPSSSDDSPVLSFESHKRKENPSSNPRGRENHVMLSKCNAKKSMKDGHTVHKRRMYPPNVTENHASSQSNKKMRSIGPMINHDSRNLTLSSGRKEFKSSKKTSLNLAVLSKKKLARKHLRFKKKHDKLHSMSGSDQEALDQSSVHGQDNFVEPRVENAAQMENPRFLKTRKRREDSHGVHDKNNDSFAGSNDKEDENPDEFVCEPTDGGETFVAFGESLGSEFPILSGSSDVDLVLDGEQQMFCADQNVIISNTRLLAEDNANEDQGNYFLDVDPIPIPGPPGSFLPSPGRMGSDEHQGNSSLTTCRLHSSEDEHDQPVDDSSDSPISATLFASNSVVTGSDSVSFAKLSSQSYGVQNESKVDLPSPETSPLRFKNTQPCCCSRREGVSQSYYSGNYQESQLLMGRDPNNELYGFDLASKPEKSVAPAKSPKFPYFGDCDSPSSSTPNPVLRLMGKNLMVVNNEENMKPQTMPASRSIHADFPELPLHSSRNGLLGFGGSFTTPIDIHEYGSKIRLSNPVRHEVEKSQNPVSQFQSKEIIVMDDSPENEANFDIGATYGENDKSGRSALGQDLGLADPPYSYQTRYYPACGGYQTVQQAVHGQTAPSKKTNENFVSWNNNLPEGSSVLFPPNSSSYFSSGFPLPTNFT